MLLVVLSLQVATFVALGVMFIAAGELRFGLAQLLLGVVQLVIYSGGKLG